MMKRFGDKSKDLCKYQPTSSQTNFCTDLTSKPAKPTRTKNYNILEQKKQYVTRQYPPPWRHNSLQTPYQRVQYFLSISNFIIILFHYIIFLLSSPPRFPARRNNSTLHVPPVYPITAGGSRRSRKQQNVFISSAHRALRAHSSKQEVRVHQPDLLVKTAPLRLRTLQYEHRSRRVPVFGLHSGVRLNDVHKRKR